MCVFCQIIPHYGSDSQRKPYLIWLWINELFIQKFRIESRTLFAITVTLTMLYCRITDFTDSNYITSRTKNVKAIVCHRQDCSRHRKCRTNNRILTLWGLQPVQAVQDRKHRILVLWGPLPVTGTGNRKSAKTAACTVSAEQATQYRYCKDCSLYRYRQSRTGNTILVLRGLQSVPLMQNKQQNIGPGTSAEQTREY
jgi:hypothetical protein